MRRRKRKEAEHEARMQELHRRVMADEQLNPAESYAWRKWAGHLPSEPRRKKKRKKKKLPRAPRPRQGCRRLCDHQRQVPAALRVLCVPRQNGGHSCSATETGTHSVFLGPGAVLGQSRWTQSRVEVQWDVRVRSSSCGAYCDVVHSPFQQIARTIVATVTVVTSCSVLSLRSHVLRGCLRRDVVWWWRFFS